MTPRPAPDFNPRQFFLPKLPELQEQCPSCPFREGNHEEFGGIVRKLCKVEGKSYHPGRTELARAIIREDAESFGDFACHHTVYNDDMSLKDLRERRQCPGATKWFKEAGEP